MRPLSERRRRSARERFKACPASYAATYVHDVDDSSPTTRRGSVFHRAAELYTRSLASAETMADWELAQRALKMALVEFPLPSAEEVDVRSLWARFAERFELPVSQFYAAESDNLTAFGAAIRYDLVLVPQSDTILIVDFKTNWQLPPRSRLEDGYQSFFYCAAARRLFAGFSRFILRYDFVRFNEQIDIEYDAATLDSIEDSIAESDEAMDRAEAENDFPATGGSHCALCSAKCPLVENPHRAPARLKHPHEAIGLLAAYHRQVEHLRTIIREHCGEHGPLESGGITWGHRQQEMKTYPADTVLQILQETKTEFRPMMSRTAVKPLLSSKRKYAHIAEQIEATAIVKTRTVFGPRVESLEDVPTPEDEES